MSFYFWPRQFSAMNSYPTFLVSVLLFIYFDASLASEGDRSPYYQNCVFKCRDNNCTSNWQKFKPSVASLQPLLNILLLWSCDEECRYDCMWKTVHAFEDRGFPMVKFHGKWPFQRILGVQEWGSVIGSVLNLVAHLLMFNKLNATFSGRNTPLLWLWRIFSIVCVHGWTWSIIFHARDTPFTEFMDYACALSMVMILFIASIIRIMYGRSGILTNVVVGVSLLYYADHVQYLFVGPINYQYNMIANIVPGALSVFLWTSWGLWRYRRHHYTWRLLLFNMLATLMLSLELLDFPPYMWLWDAHALWHVATSVLPFLFYRFVHDDLMYLRQSWPSLVIGKSDTKIC